MASQNLQTNIVINARTGNGFSQVGNTLTELGSMINGVSQQLINFGKESVTVYRNYEKSMADAEVALSTTYGRGTRELRDVMSQLDVVATNWAATTIFHTNDVGNAIAEAAHAGWNLDQIMSGLPAAMQLAQAGSIDLSDAVNYIVKATSAAGVEFDEVGHFIDLWAFAANSSATNIDEMGEAMLRMGSTMRFAGSTEELMTLIAVTANAGATGSEAGTMIRNSMMRLIAPTDKAKKAMAQLGATSDETAALLDDASLAAANAELAAHGFSAFYQDGPKQGQMKNVLDIYRELYVALGDIAGGYENIDRNGAALSVLSSIFPTRTITEALTLLRGAAEGYDGLYEAMKGGDAAGYGEYAATTMMDTLDGQIETFESKVERLKQLVGEELSGQVEQVLGSVGGIVDKIAELPEDQFSALVTGLEVIAAAGPGLLLAGGAFRLIGTLLTPAGGIGLGLVALTAAAAAIKQLEEADFSSNFGNLELDTQGIQTYVQGLGADFKEAYTQVDNLGKALDTAVQNYQTASTTFSSTLFTDMITHAQLGEEEIAKLESLGQDMFLAVQGAISSSAAASMSYWNTLFGGEGEAEYDPAYQRIIELTNEAYTNAMAEAEGIGQGLRDAMTAAFEDGEVSDEEYQKILKYMQAYNDAIARAAAEAQSEEDFIKMGKWLHQAQTASLDEIKEIGQSAQTERDQILADQEDRYLTERFRLEYRGADAETLARTDALYQRQRMQVETQYDEFLFTLWDSQLRQSGQAANYNTLMGYAQQYMSGQLTGDAINNMLREQMGKSMYAGDSGWGDLKGTDRAQLGRLMGYMIGSMGGGEGVAERIAYYESIGNADMAGRLRQMYAMEQLVNNFGESMTLDKPAWDILNLAADFTTSNVRSSDPVNLPLQMNKTGAETAIFGSAELAKTYTELLTLRQKQTTLAADIQEAEQWASKARTTSSGAVVSNDFLGRDLDALSKLYGNYAFGKYSGGGLYDQAEEVEAAIAAAEARIAELQTQAQNLTPGFDQNAVNNMPPVVIPIQPKQSGEDSMTSLQDQGVTVEVGADSTELQATIEAEDGQTLTEYLNGDAEDLHLTIWAEDGQLLTENVTGNASQLAAIINSYNGRTITVNIAGKKLFASGGRATSASIFGEDGPEWAIPEAHTERTAALLNAAREASGFTWPDLMERFGGLNANPGNRPTTIVYSPTINAQDATGVEQVLRNDKERLDKWFEEKKMHDEVEVYS